MKINLCLISGLCALNAGAMVYAASANSSTVPNSSPASTSANSQSAANISRSDRTFVEKAAKAGMEEIAVSRAALPTLTNQQAKDFASMMVSDHTGANQELMALASRKGITLPNQSDNADWVAKSGGGSAGAVSASGSVAGADSSNAATTTRASTSNDSIARGTNMNGANPSTSYPSGSSAVDAGSAKAGAGAGSVTGTPANSAGIGRSDASSTGVAGSADAAYINKMVKDHEEAVSLFTDASKQASDSDIRAFATKTLPKLQAHLDQARSIQQSAKR